MVVIVICSLLALLFSFLETKKLMPNGTKWGFALITIIGMIHYDYGNDYKSYYTIFKLVESQPFDFNYIMEGDIFHDTGWVLLCYLFKHIGGFFMMVAVLNLVQNIIIYRFIEKEVPFSWRPFSLFIYLFTTSFFLMSFTMMRQWFVACIFIGLWPLIKQKKWMLPLAVIYFCSFVHQSAILLLPFAFWGFVPMKNSKLYIVIFASLLVFLWTSATTLNSLLETVVDFTETTSYMERYEDNDRLTVVLGMGMILDLIPLFVASYFLFKADEHFNEEKKLVALSIIGFAITPLLPLAPMIGRLGVYFGIFGIASKPVVYGFVKNKIIRIGLITLYCLIVVYDYVYFFSNPVWAPHYSIFHTIFSVL